MAELRWGRYYSSNDKMTVRALPITWVEPANQYVEISEGLGTATIGAKLPSRNEAEPPLLGSLRRSTYALGSRCRPNAILDVGATQ